MQVKNIIIIVIIVILFIILIGYVTKDVNTLSGLQSAQTMQKIEATTLAPTTSAGSASNFTYSIWFFIDDWNYRYGEPKVVFGRMTTGQADKEPCPAVTLGPIQNNINVSLAVYSSPTDTQPNETTNYIIENFSLANVPIQRWCNLLLSAYGRTLDLYLDGKLVRTCVLSGVAKIDSTAPVYITPNGGFSGWTSNFQYWSNSTDPQQAWNIYSAGYGSSSIGNLFGQYKVKISLMQNDTEDTSITI
jgi:hypothetical protein